MRFSAPEQVGKLTLKRPTLALANSKAECEQFNGGNPKHENCERYRIVFEPNTHDPPLLDRTCRHNGSLRLRDR